MLTSTHQGHNSPSLVGGAVAVLIVDIWSRGAAGSMTQYIPQAGKLQ